MRLWTIQDERVMEHIKECGSYHVSIENTWPNALADFLGEPDRHVQIAYDWIASKMEQSIGCPPEGVKYPIWAWVKQPERPWSDPTPGKPDMRSWITSFPEKVVRLELEVPDEECFITDFDIWHVPLNFAYLSIDEQEENEWDEWLKSKKLSYTSPSDLDDKRSIVLEARERIISSWDRLLTLDKLDPEYWGLEDPDRQCLQANFWVLKAEYIVSTEYFITRSDEKGRRRRNKQAQRNRFKIAKRQLSNISERYKNAIATGQPWTDKDDLTLREAEYGYLIEKHGNDIRKTFEHFFNPVSGAAINTVLSLTDHNVQKLQGILFMVEENIYQHDESKYSKQEYQSCRRHFCPTDREISELEMGEYDDVQIFREAIGFHYQHNPHHPQYWCDESGTPEQDMPLEYIIEMLCDWIVDCGGIASVSKNCLDQRLSIEMFYMTDTTKATIKNLINMLFAEKDA